MALAILLVALCGTLLSPAALAQREMTLPDATRQQMDHFAGHRLRQADTAFNNRNWRLATTEYDGFLLEFGDSVAVPYAILRKGRSLQLDGKRFEAIRVYQDILDFFPNDTDFAPAALYYQGLCYKENGDLGRAMVPWARLADDAAYSRHPLAASALNELAEYFHAQGNAPRAANYFQQVALTFRRDNPEAARAAIAQTVRYYVRIRPNEEALRQFYQDAQTFHHHPRPAGDDLLNNRDYWSAVRQAIAANSQFAANETDQARVFYGYWAGQMQGRFEDWDDYQIDRITFQYRHDGQQVQWMQRLDEQFERHQRPDRQDRVVTWIGLYAKHPPKVEAYFQKIDFAAISNEDLLRLMLILIRDAEEIERAKSVFARVQWDQVSDEDKFRQFLNHLRGRNTDWLWFWVQTAARYQDQDLGLYHLLRFVHWHYMHWRGDEFLAEGLRASERLTQVDRFASQAWMWRGDLLSRSGDQEQAIAAYRQSSEEPANLFAVARCLRDLGSLDQAIAQLREIENFFKDQAPTAALRQGEYYRAADNSGQAIAAFRAVLRKYPQSGASRQAHIELQQLGVDPGGGVGAR